MIFFINYILHCSKCQAYLLSKHGDFFISFLEYHHITILKSCVGFYFGGMTLSSSNKIKCMANGKEEEESCKNQSESWKFVSKKGMNPRYYYNNIFICKMEWSHFLVTILFVCVIADLLLKYEESTIAVLPQMAQCLDIVQDPKGLSAIIWILGEYGQVL